MEYPRNVRHPMAINPSKYAKPLIWISIGLTAGLTDFLMDSHAIKGIACRAWNPSPCDQMILPPIPVKRPALMEIHMPVAKDTSTAIMA